jgi:hypothetical protein
MGKGKEKVTLSIVKEEPIEMPVEKAGLVISDAVAADFMKEVNGVQETLLPKQNAFVESLVKDIQKATKPRPSRAKPKEPKEPSESHASKMEPDDSTKKAAHIAKITMNANAFEPLLKDYLKPTKEAYLAALPKRSSSELELMLKSLEHARLVGNATNQLKQLVFIGASAVEVASKRVGLKTDGYAQALRAQEEEIKMILQEIAMERAEAFTKFQRPEVRLALILSTTLISLDNANRLKEYQESTKKETVQPLVEEQYRDL